MIVHHINKINHHTGHRHSKNWSHHVEHHLKLAGMHKNSYAHGKRVSYKDSISERKVQPLDSDNEIIKHNDKRPTHSIIKVMPDYIVRQLLKNRPTFGNSEIIALQKLKYDIICKLEIIYNSLKWKYKREQKTENNMFSWDYSTFLERRNLTNTVWIEVLRKELKLKNLEFHKFAIDIQELFHVLNIIFDAQENDDENNNTTLSMLQEMKEHLTTSEKLEKDIKLNRFKFCEAINTLLMYNIPPDAYQLEKKRRTLEDITNIEVLTPIEQRYELNFWQSLISQKECKYQIMNEKHRNKMDHYKILLNNTANTTDCILNKYYADIQDYKYRIMIMSEKYETDFENIDSKNSDLKMKIDKIRHRKKYLADQILRFREEIANIGEKGVPKKKKRLTRYSRRRTTISSL